MDLSQQKCEACEGIGKPLDKKEAQSLLQELSEWQINEEHTQIYKDYTFKNFYQTMSFVNAVAHLSNKENHHPDMEVGYQHALLRYSTHALGGLSKNDFICAKKADLLLTL